ncbi:MAG: response regulator transcription factor [Dermatophilaceae bacterium]
MRVLVVDDQELMRRGLTMLLSTEDDVDVVGEASEGREALALVPRTCPDVVLTDARMPIMDGVDLVASLARAHPGLPAVILTTFDDHDLVQRALAAGAAGFMLKDSSIADLVHAMRSALAGGLVIDPRVARAALSGAAGSRSGGPGGPASPLAVLTRAERGVAELVATGATNGEIAERLVIAEGTVKNHVSALLRKLDQRDRTGLALLLSRYLG